MATKAKWIPTPPAVALKALANNTALSDTEAQTYVRLHRKLIDLRGDIKMAQHEAREIEKTLFNFRCKQS